VMFITDVHCIISAHRVKFFKSFKHKRGGSVKL